MSRAVLIAWLILGTAAGAPARAAEADAAGIEFFEKHIRPVLVRECYECHSSEAKILKGGLRLDNRAGLLAGGDTGPAVVPGEVDESPLVQALRYGDNSYQMPPKGKLPDKVIADFEQWVKLGAPDPRLESVTIVKTEIDFDAARKFWSFQSPQMSTVPQVADADWPQTAIDRFILARQAERGLKPVDGATRERLIRRAYFDLVGLPPEPDDIDRFVRDESPRPFETLVDWLLASSQFGERWGRHWLDLVRYAESTGRSVNYPLNHAWRYRDYVIDSLNADKPYDQFIREQIAGDLLPAETAEQANQQRIATGFLTVGPRELDFDDRKEAETQRYFLSSIDEQIDLTCRAILGLTVSCARCHDHKFDPIPTTDYYALAGIFRSSEQLVGLVHGVGNSARYTPDRLIQLEGLDPAGHETYQKHVASVMDLFKQAKANLNELWTIRRREGKPGYKDEDRVNQEKVVKGIDAQYDALLKKLPRNMPVAMGLADAAQPIDMHVYIGGDVENLGPLAPRGFLRILGADPAVKIPDDHSGRLELAHWLASPSNPLTARVMVNRIWHHLFGRGLVPTVDNFGTGGDQPSHPELLDYLAVRFMDEGWSVKCMIREIMLSRVYQLSSGHNAANYAVDPDNVLLWRMSRRRLEVEPLRDAMLAVSGRLDLSRPAESALMKTGAQEIRDLKEIPPEARTAHGNHRTVYQTLVRDMEPEMFHVFDFPSTSNVHGSRNTTTVATQALFLMNNPLVIDLSRHAARALLAMKNLDAPQRVELAYRRALGRRPSTEETSRALDYLADYDPPTDAPGQEPQLDAWGTFYQALFASAEFCYVE